MGLPWPAFFNCSLLPLPLTLSLSPSAYVFCQLSVQAFFHPLQQVKAWTFLNITHATSLLSSLSQARTSSYFSFTASFGFVIFNTILKRQFKSLQLQCTQFSYTFLIFHSLVGHREYWQEHCSREYGTLRKYRDTGGKHHLVAA